MLIICIIPIILIKFIKVREMFGMCQNVEIIHQHHHHFFQLVVPYHSKNHSSLSKTFSQPSSHAQISPHAPQENGMLHETHTSRFYHSKRSYLGKNQKGIEVVTGKDIESFQYQNITILKNQNENSNSKPITINPFILPASRENNIKVSKNYQHTKYLQYEPKQSNNQVKNLCYSIQKSVPSVEINYASKNSSVKTKKNHLNCHRLKQSKIKFNNTSIYDTKKKTWQFNNTETNITLSIPTNSHKNKMQKPASQIMKKTPNDKDSILTKKQNKFLSAFKTQTMFDDAKSIISRQSLDKSQINVEESIIINRTMDYFCQITPEKELDCCKMYLATDSNINWMVTIRLFEFKHEIVSLRQSQMYNRVSRINRDNVPLLNLYKVMIQGVGLQKNIYFVLQPYQITLEQYLKNKKDYYKAVSASLNYFMLDLEEQLLSGLFQLERQRVILNEPIKVTDIVIVTGKFKFHSISKFTFISGNQIISPQVNLRLIQKLKGQILQALRSF